MLYIMLLLFLLSPFSPPQSGWASGYAENVMEGVVERRFANNWWWNEPPPDWFLSHGSVAVMDCSDVGRMMTLIDPAGRAYRVLAADCAGDDGPVDRFERMGVIVELDYPLWAALTEEFGRPLRVGLIDADPGRSLVVGQPAPDRHH